MSGLYITSLVMAVLSLVAAVAALLLFSLRNRSSPSSSSMLLWIVMSLIFSDVCVALCVLVWHFLQHDVSDPTVLDKRCRIFLPFPIFFFLAGYGWTIRVAWRFQQVSEVLPVLLLCAIVYYILYIIFTVGRRDGLDWVCAGRR
jgi:hypothetical protein